MKVGIFLEETLKAKLEELPEVSNGYKLVNLVLKNGETIKEVAVFNGGLVMVDDKIKDEIEDVVGVGEVPTFSNKQITNFLDDVLESAEIELIEGEKIPKELIEEAKKRGILVKNSKDLAVIKTVFAFCDLKNGNGVILPEKEWLKVQGQLIGKPMNINHIRPNVVGAYFSVDYEKKEKKIIAYAVFYKQIFSELYQKIKYLHSEGKLSTSFEIWAPEDKRKYVDENTYEIHAIEVAGGALILEEGGRRPAFEDAKVMELALKQIEEESGLVFASVNEADLITSSQKSKEEGGEIMEQKLKAEEAAEVEKTDAELEAKKDDAASEVAESSEVNDKAAEEAKAESTEEKAEKESEEAPAEEAEKTSEENKETEKSEEEKSEEKEAAEEKSETSEEKAEEAPAERKLVKISYVRITAGETEFKDNSRETTDVYKWKTIYEYSDGTTETVEGDESSKVIYTKAELDQAIAEAVEVAVETVKKELDEKVEFYKENAATIAERKAELGEFAKDLSDEEILDEKTFENASLKKKLSEKGVEEEEIESSEKKKVNKKPYATRAIDYIAFGN